MEREEKDRGKSWEEGAGFCIARNHLSVEMKKKKDKTNDEKFM